VNVSAERYKKVFVFTFELKSSKYKDDSTLDYGVLGTLIGSQHFGSFLEALTVLHHTYHRRHCDILKFSDFANNFCRELACFYLILKI